MFGRASATRIIHPGIFPIHRSPSALKLLSCSGIFAGLIAIASPAQAEIVVGLAIPASGREQATGAALRTAAERAIAELNAAGGVLGETVKLAVVDDLCSDAGAISAANAFMRARAKLVTGHPCTKAALAAAQVYGPAGMLFIATATRHPALTDKRAGKTIFRLSGRDDQQAVDAANWLLAQSGTGPIAIVLDKTAYSRGLATGAAAALVAKTQPPPLDFPITAGENVYAPVIAKLKELKPRAVFFAGYPAEANIVVTALRDAGLTQPVLGSDSLATPEFTLQSAASDPAVRVLARSGQYPGSVALNLPGNLDSAKYIDTASPPSAIGPALQTAEAIFTWAAACARASSIESAKISENLATPNTGPGIIVFNEKGDARVSSFIAVQWSGKDWQSKN